jgi:hypothetical protein
MFDVRVRVHKDQNSLLIQGPSQQIDAVVAVLEALDVPSTRRGSSFEVYGYLIAASQHEEGLEGITPALEPVTKQLADLFGYRGFRLLDTVFLLNRHGSEGRVDGSFELDGKTTKFAFSFDRGRVLPDGDGQHTVRLDGLHLITDAGASLTTDVDVKEGQTVVVGKARLDVGEGALVLVIRTEVADGDR